jgi:hypothetical protein
MINLHVIDSLGAEPGDETPRTRRRLPLRIAEIREVQAPPAPTPLPGHLCEACLDAPAVLVVPSPEGGDMGICAACQQAAAVGPLPAWGDRCVATAPARVCPCGSYRLRWGEDEATRPPPWSGSRP